MANEETIIGGNMQNANVAGNAAAGAAGKAAGKTAGKTAGAAASGAWKPVTIGGVTGILMGAGGIMGMEALAGESPAAETPAEDAAGLKVAHVSDDMSFSEAFAAARAEVGPGGVFHWHGGIFNTYYAEEWNAMSDADKQEFAQQIQPEIPAHDVTTDHIETAHVTTVHHEGHVEHHHYHHDDNGHAAAASQHNTANQHNTAHHEQQHAESDDDLSGFEQDGVRIVGHAATDDGHVVVAYDADGDNQADLVLIDMDDNHYISGPDVLVDPDGNQITVEELVKLDSEDVPGTGLGGDEDIMAQNPDVAPDGMPDYMDDGLVEA